MKLWYIVLNCFFFISFCVAQNCVTETWHHGEGTFYGGVAGGTFGNCLLPLAADDSLHCAMNQIEYDSSNMCNACVRVLGPRGEVVVRVADRCPECKVGDIDFSPQAFKILSNVKDGRIKISWQVVPCPVNGNMTLVFKDGSSQFWTGVQVRNSKFPIAKLELKNGNNYETIHREMYNYFIDQNGLDLDKSKAGPYQFRITSVNGEAVESSEILFDTSKNEQNTQVQFSYNPCKDCFSVTDGNAFIDNCGVCVGGTTGKIANSTCIKDCNGYYYGTAYIDDCGRCVMGETGLRPCGYDCAGDLAGTALIDVCGKCTKSGEVPCKTNCNDILFSDGYFGSRCEDLSTDLGDIQIEEKGNLIKIYNLLGAEVSITSLSDQQLYLFVYQTTKGIVTKKILYKL